MPLDPHAKRLLDMMAVAASRNAASATIEMRRDSFARLMALSGAGPPVGSVAERTIPGPGGALPLRLYTPQAAPVRPLPALVYFHGGGLVAGSLDTHDAFCRVLAEGTGARVIAVGYRLAPEHKFPGAILDGQAATTWIFSNAAELEIDPRRIGVAGDSGGGTLATVVCQAALAAQAPPIALQLLLCPVLDLGPESQSRQEFAKGYLLDRATLERDFMDYSPGDLDRTDWRVSPLRAVDVSGLAPAFVHTAEFDPLRDEGAAYADRLARAGVQVHYTCHPGMIHHFYGLTTIIPAARAAVEAICREVRAALAEPSH
jgi:acetyl esterase/lipase